MKKAFLFDLDGVIIDDEQIWEKAKEKIYLQLFGPEIVLKMGPTMGINIDGIYELAVKCGSKQPKELLVKFFYNHANDIYKTAPITKGLDELVQTLRKNNFQIGIVSASPQEWIDITVDRLSFKKDLALILSLYDDPHLRHKPEPDGYLKAMEILSVKAENTIVLEDSNAGIASAKSVGTFTIGLTQNLIKGYKQTGADVYAEDLNEVIKIAEDFN